MSTSDLLWFLFEAAARSLVLAVGVGIVLAAVRVNEVRLRLSLWTGVLLASLLMPLLIFVAPPITITSAHPPVLIRAIATVETVAAPSRLRLPGDSEEASKWPGLLGSIYAASSLVLLIRLAAGVSLGRRLRRCGRLVSESELPALLGELSARAGLSRMPEVIESTRVVVPLVYGWRRPVLLLPAGWSDWDEAKSRSVFGHELSHIAEGDFARQALCRLHTALFPFNPLSWWLERKLSDLCEQLSDDEGVCAAGDAVAYADVVLGFLGARRAADRRMTIEGGVAMARLSNGARRVERILDGSGRVPAGSSKLKRAIIMAGMLPLVGLAAACGWSSAQSSAGRFVNTAFAQVKEAAGGKDGAYVYVYGRGSTMNGTDLDRSRAESYRGRYGDQYLWFRQAGREYVIVDRKLLSEIDAATEPQREIGELQAKLGEQQAKLGEHQAAIGEQQASTGVEMPDLVADVKRLEGLVNALKNRKISQSDVGDLQSEIGILQGKIGEIQSKLGEVQSVVGEKQAVLGEQQARLGAEQAELGTRQERAAVEMQRKLAEIMERAIRSGAARKP